MNGKYWSSKKWKRDINKNYWKKEKMVTLATKVNHKLKIFKWIKGNFN